MRTQRLCVCACFTMCKFNELVRGGDHRQTAVSSSKRTRAKLTCCIAGAHSFIEEITQPSDMHTLNMLNAKLQCQCLGVAFQRLHSG